jgi:hypothetical protein
VTGVTRAQWSAILDLSAVMLRHAKAGEWLRLADLEVQRRTMINTDMQHPPQDSDCEAYARVLQSILSLDRQIMALAHTGQAELVKELQGIALGRTAVQAYAQQSR